MADLAVLTEQVNTLGQAWEQFKSANDARLKEIEKKGSADYVTVDQVNRINSAIDEHKEKIEALYTAANRKNVGDDAGAKEGIEAAEHKKAFNSYVKKGIDTGLGDLQVKALSVHVDSDGGYLVPNATSAEIVKIVYETSPIRPIVSVETISTDSLDYNEDRDEVSSGWVSETGARAETDTPQVGKGNIPTHEIYCQPKATQKFLDDAAINVEAWLAANVAEYLARKENTAFVTGDGNGKPRGILTYAAGTSWGQIEQIASGSSGSYDGDDLIDLMYGLKEGYAANATWLMNRLTVKMARKLKWNDDYVFQPAMSGGMLDTIFGRPIVMAADMPVPAADSLSIAFGDFKKAYKIVDRAGIRTLRDPFTDKPFVKFYTTKRVGGAVTNFEAVKLLKLGS